ncbi:MAG TPA: DMT family protein [Phycisphaerales bacterium]|nr:DMT family protein [Phycisphaerales bacterium]
MAPRWLLAVLLLTASNIFMTYAWYYHVKQKQWALWTAILISWAIAGVEYCLQVPANRLGHVNFGGPFTAPQLKVLQEALTLVVFAIFSITVLNEKLRNTDLLAFCLIFAAVIVAFMGPHWKGLAWINGVGAGQ